MVLWCIDFRQQSVVIIILSLYQKPKLIHFGAFIQQKCFRAYYVQSHSLKSFPFVTEKNPKH